MSNYYDNRLNTNDNDQQQRSNQQGASRVVEIPVIHCTPSDTKQPQPQPSQPHHHHHHHHQPPQPQTQSYSPSSSSRFYQQPQHSPSQRTNYFEQPLITEDFNAPFDHFDSGFPRRLFTDPLGQDSPIDEFFSRSPFHERDFFSGRRSPLINTTYPHPQVQQHRLGSDYHKSPLGSPKNSPKLSPRVEKSQTPTRTVSTNTDQPPPQQQQENPPSPPQHHHHHHHQQPHTSFTIPVNYVKTDREKSPNPTSYPSAKYTPAADIPFSTYSSSPKPETPSVAEQLANYRREQQQQQQQQQDRQRSPAPQQKPTSTSTTTTTTTDTRRSPSPKESGNMGGTNQKQSNSTQLPSDFIKLATDAANMNTPPRSTTPIRPAKTSQEKIDEINGRLASLDKEVDNYSGVEGKKDRQFLLLEEHLTQCLLKLDEIDRDNDDINRQRRALIKATQAIIDKLESKIRTKTANDQDEDDATSKTTATTTNNDDKNKLNENNSDSSNQINNNSNNSDNK